MIKINIFQIYDEASWKKWRRWRQDCNRETCKLIDAVHQGYDPEINEVLYKRKSIKKMFFFNRSGPFGGKCAYCEKYIKDGLDADIDHYRPKRGVTDENDRPVMVQNELGVAVYHPGYYWLAYDWRNLLPVCKHCNVLGEAQGEKVGKQNRFPVENIHAIQPGDELIEQPLLLNPVYDDPNEHLEVQSESGLLIFKSLRGDKTIKILGLNLRDRLPETRRQMIDHVGSLLDRVFSRYTDEATKRNAIDELLAIKQGKQNFTLAARCYIKSYLKKMPPGFEQLLNSGEG